jgi:uncharacterized membrane protein YoaK (UPF0700 family)
MTRIITNQTIKSQVRDLLLNSLTVSSGAIDAISFLSLGKVFTAFMTGNIAFLGLRVSGNSSPDGVSILTSMVAFALGVVVSTRMVRSVKDSVFWSDRVTVVLSISLIAQAAFLVVWFGVHGRPSTNTIHYLLGFWGFAMGMQSAAVRKLHVEGVFTTAATATYIFLAGDITNWSATSVERKRLTGILISLFIGATAGGLLLIHVPIYAPVLPFAMNVVIVTIAAIFFRTNVERNFGDQIA